MKSKATVGMAPGRENEFAVEVFGTAPQSKDWDKSEYPRQVANVARWKEEAGCAGILVYT